MGRLPPEREPSIRTEIPAEITAVINRIVERAVRLVTLEVHANLVSAPEEGGTPIATGWARSNWIPSVGDHSADVVGSKESVSVTEANDGVMQVLTYHLNQGLVFVTNNVPYIVLLNNGSSQQAPAGFVDAAVARAVNTLELSFSSLA